MRLDKPHNNDIKINLPIGGYKYKMIDDFRFIKISNGWILTIVDRGIQKENIYDVYLENKEDIIKWIKDNIKN